MTTPFRLMTMTALGLLWLWLGMGLGLSAASAQMLWQVDGPEAQRSWLVGTVHSEDARVLAFSETLLEVIAAAEVLALELVMDADTLAALSGAMVERGPALVEVVAADTVAEVAEALAQDYGLPRQAVERLTVWAAANLLTLPPPQTGVFMDLALQQRAQQVGMAVVALETLEEQLAFLSDMPLALQQEWLTQALAELDQRDGELARLIEVYLMDDLEALAALTAAGMADVSPEFQAFFQTVGLDQRNHTMLTRAQPLLQDGGVLIAVGALHLIGETGLLAQLRDAGYTLTPLPPPHQ